MVNYVTYIDNSVIIYTVETNVPGFCSTEKIRLRSFFLNDSFHHPFFLRISSIVYSLDGERSPTVPVGGLGALRVPGQAPPGIGRA